MYWKANFNLVLLPKNFLKIWKRRTQIGILIIGKIKQARFFNTHRNKQCSHQCFYCFHVREYSLQTSNRRQNAKFILLLRDSEKLSKSDREEVEVSMFLLLNDVESLGDCEILVNTSFRRRILENCLANFNFYPFWKY